MNVAEAVEAYREHGYFVVERAVDEATLALLRREADAGVAEEDAALRRGGAQFVPVSVRDDRYVATGRARQSGALAELLHSQILADVCRAALGPDAFLFSETFVCKEPRNAHGWIWHQDASYLASQGFVGPPNLSVWIAIDRMTADNGTLEVMPWSTSGIHDVVPHDLDKPWDSEEVVSFGAHPSTLLPIEPGSLVALSGLLPHKSAPNRTDERRRAYLVQYSQAPVLDDAGRPRQLAVPVLRAGERLPPPGGLR